MNYPSQLLIEGGNCKEGNRRKGKVSTWKGDGGGGKKEEIEIRGKGKPFDNPPRCMSTANRFFFIDTIRYSLIDTFLYGKVVRNIL